MRRVAAIAGTAAAVILMSGCTSEVTTAITVTGADEATVEVAAVFTGEAAQMLATDEQTLEQLVGVFRDRTGQDPIVVVDDDRVEVRDDLAYTELADARDLVGIGEVGLSGADDEVTLTLATVPPTELADAVRAATAGQPDAGPLAATMLKSTEVTVTVAFPGGLTGASGPATTTGETSVTYTRTADSRESAVMAVSGDPTAARWPLLVGAAGVVAGAALWLRQRRQRGVRKGL